MKLTSLLLTLGLAVSCLQFSRAVEAEIKFIVHPDCHEAAWGLLNAQLKETDAAKVAVCFFETQPPSLGELILRARKKKDDPDDSTVKVRVTGDGASSGPTESAIAVELDYSNPDKANRSKSCDWEPLPKNLFDKVMNGEESPKALFEGSKQGDLIKERAPTLDWASIRRYGPIAAQVWKKAFELSATFPKVTVEHWRMKNATKSTEVLELSAKVKAATEEEAAKQAAAFFKEVTAAGFGEPLKESKTRLVLEFYQSGK